MFATTRQWLRRNRTPIAIGLGVVGAGYVVTQYVLHKLNDARERMSSDRIAKENLRRRFEQNQEDCTFTVLALLPTATTNILEAMNTEKITYEIQQLKGVKSARSIGSASPPSLTETNATEEDGRSMVSKESESGVHASQMVMSLASPAAVTGTESAGATTGVTAPESKEESQSLRKTKRQLWDELTISSISRAFTLLYTLALLTVLTRIQLNLLGRRSYLSSVVSLAVGSVHGTISLENNDDDNSEPTNASDFEINRKYLTFSWWLLNRGWVDVMQRVETAVRQVFGHLSPRDSITFENFARLTKDVRILVEGSNARSGGGTRWLPHILPTPDMEEFVLRESGILDEAGQPLSEAPSASSPSAAASLRRLLDETSDLIESPAFASVLTQLLDAGFHVLLDTKLRPSAFEPPPPQSAPATTVQTLQLGDRAVLLPKILSVLARQAHAVGNGMPNEYLEEMETVRDLEGFAAVVYSSNWEAEVTRGGNDETSSGLMASAVHVAPRESSTADPSMRQSQVSGASAGDESLIVVDPQSSLESAWERASETK